MLSCMLTLLGVSVVRDKTFFTTQIEKTKELIDLYDTAITAILTGGVESYTLDTGQSIQKVTKLNISKYQAVYDSLLNRLATLNARVYGCGVTHVRGC